MNEPSVFSYRYPFYSFNIVSVSNIVFFMKNVKLNMEIGKYGLGLVKMWLENEE